MKITDVRQMHNLAAQYAREKAAGGVKVMLEAARATLESHARVNGMTSAQIEMAMLTVREQAKEQEKAQIAALMEAYVKGASDALKIISGENVLQPVTVGIFPKFAIWQAVECKSRNFVGVIDTAMSQSALCASDREALAVQQKECGTEDETEVVYTLIPVVNGKPVDEVRFVIESLLSPVPLEMEAELLKAVETYEGEWGKGGESAETGTDEKEKGKTDESATIQ